MPPHSIPPRGQRHALHRISCLGFLGAALALALAAPSLLAFVDTNHDGLSDVWTKRYPAASTPAADPDGDGFSNTAEAIAGTHPHDSTSRPTLLQPSPTATGFQLRWFGVVGKTYHVDESTNLKNWVSRPGLDTGTDADLTRAIPAAAASPRMFWRVVVNDDDADADGLTNWEEAQLGTNSAAGDSDSDGMLDGWEVAHALNPRVNDALADLDSDGYTNLRECLAGTDPQVRALPAPAGPIVFWASQPVAPDESILVTCGGTDLDSTAELARLTDTAPGSPLAAAPAPTGWTAVTPHTATPRSITVTVPGNWTRGVYALRLKHKEVAGPVRLVNAPDPWFVRGDQGSTASPGGHLVVAGTCLEIPGGAGPRAALVANNAVVAELTTFTRLTTSSGYALQFTVPANVPAGTYALHLHNGCGGPAGWVHFSTFIESPLNSVTIAPLLAWPTESIPVAAPTGSDDGALAAALATAQAKGGGRVVLAAGTYTLSERVLLPNRTTLVGAGRDKTTLRWRAAPTSPIPYGGADALLQGKNLTYPIRNSNYSLENLTIEASVDFSNYVVARTFASEPVHFTQVSITGAHSSDFPGARSIALLLMDCANTRIEGSTLSADACLLAHRGVTYLRMTGCTLQWSNGNVQISARSHSLIFDNNVLDQVGDSATNNWAKIEYPNPGLCYASFYGNPYFSGPYTRDVLWTANRSTRQAVEVPPEYVGSTSDGGDGLYLGRITSVSGRILTLAAPTFDARFPAGQLLNFDWAGSIAQIVDGRGAGQWRFLTTAGPRLTTVVTDRPWDIEPDTTSVLAIVNLQGRLLMIDNDYAQEPLNQDYFLTLDSIKAGNRFGVTGGTAMINSKAGQHYHATHPAWHFQVLDNAVTRGDQTTFMSVVPDRTVGYTGVVGGSHVYRNNRNTSGNPVAFRLLSKEGALTDFVVEHNQFDTVKLRDRPADTIDLSGVLLRGNTLANGTPSPLTPALPPPGVTQK
ncbi:MAG: hypothetical protein IPL39_05205 [Opitutaceae bacterium]|nr:hypothetical protein [Opitutaceae bacterium]